MISRAIRRSHLARWAGLFCLSLCCCLAGWSQPDGQADPSAWTPVIEWHAGQLAACADIPDAAQATVDLVNQGAYEEALARLEAAEEVSFRLRSALAMAVAGHLDVQDPAPALALAETYLRKAIEQNPHDVKALRLQNQWALFRGVASQGLPTDPRLLPARDLVRAGKLEEGRKKIAETSADRRAICTFVLASFFERDPERGPVLLDDAAQAITQAGDPTLAGLLEAYRAYPWASLAVRPDCPLYPRTLLERMRAYYWWWRQMGEGYRPMSKQGFEELLAELSALFPDNELIRMYRGERIPWGPGFRPDSPPQGAPGWAVNQRELRARVDYIVEWWFEHRQAGDGSLGGGWEDDCETLRRWAVTSVCCGNPAIEQGIQRLVDGIWTSGELVEGYDRTFKDVEHSSEMSADTSLIVSLAYGDPLHLERLLASARTTRDIHTAVNAHGHRHFRAMKMSATEVSGEPRHAVDAHYCGRAMRPAAMVAWYSGLPEAVSLVHDWALAWSEDMLRAGAGKPAGIMPATVRFSDDSVDGPGSAWWEPGLGDLYHWLPERQGMVLGKILGAWTLSHDEALLVGPRRQFEMMQEFSNQGAGKPAEGSAEWAVGRLLGQTGPLVGAYRAVTGDDRFDELLARRASGYARFMANGDPASVEAAHAADLQAMRTNLPMVTSEVRGTDRVALASMSLLGPLTGSPAPLTEPPSQWVTWREVGPDFTALVRQADPSSAHIWAYNFGGAASHPEIRFWRLEPGRYEFSGGPDADADGSIDGEPAQRIPFECRERLSCLRFGLPAKTLWALEIRRLEAFPTRPAHLPDLALAPRDIRFPEGARADAPIEVCTTVHNIGAAEAPGTILLLRIKPDDSQGDWTEATASEVGTLPFPADLHPKTAEARCSLPPLEPGAYQLECSVRTDPPRQEIFSANNAVVVPLIVGEPEAQ